MYIGIKDGKIWDICSELKYKRDNSINDKDYLDLPMGDWLIDDTWDSINNISLNDAPIRTAPKSKTELELLQETVQDLEARILTLEGG